MENQIQSGVETTNHPAPIFFQERRKTPRSSLPFDAFGWQALERTLGRQFGSPEFIKNGESPSQPTIIYGFRLQGGTPQWLLIALGASELFEKQSDEPEISGSGYEFVLRVAGGDPEPPEAAIELLETVFEYGTKYNVPMAAGHTLDLSPMLTETSACNCGHFVIRQDPSLETALTPNGAVDFYQIVVVTEAEQAAIRDWNVEGVLQLIQEYECPELITGTGRNCLTQHSAAVELINNKIGQEGSSGEFLFATEMMQWDSARMNVMLSRKFLDVLCRRLRGRLGFGRPMSAYAADCVFEFVRSEKTEFDNDDSYPVLRLSKPAFENLVEFLEAGKQKFACPGIDSLTIEIVQ